MDSTSESPAPIGAGHGRSSVFGWVIPLLVAYVKDRGHDGSPILHLKGIRGRDLHDPDVRVPESSAREAWRLAITITGDDAIGLHLAQWLPRGSLDLVEYAFRSSPTLAVGLERLAHYGRLINDRLAVEVVQAGPGVRILIGETDAKPLNPQRAEFACAVSLRIARDATSSDLAPMEASFTHPSPRHAGELRDFFRAPLRFSSVANAMAFSDGDGARALRTADPVLADIIRRRLDRALAALDRNADADPSTAGRLRRVLTEKMGQGNPSVTTIGREMGMSARTLNRRLVEEGTSFRAIRDQVRHQLALALISDASVSIAEAAFFLGYAEPAPFHRSFKRWTGTTPQAYRRTRLAG